MVTAAERDQLVEESEALAEETIDYLQQLVRTPSVNPPGDYEAIAGLVRETCEGYGWAVETVWAPEDLLTSLEIPAEYPRPNVIATVTEGPGPTIVLNAHLDTVPVDEAEAWTHHPFEAAIEDGILYGRGATDAKGRVAAYTLAARALEASELLPTDASVVLAFTADEETGGEAGAGYLLEGTDIDPDYAIVEGTGTEIWYATTGARQYRVTVSGTAAHAGSHLDEGANALVGAAKLIDAIADYGDQLRERESTYPDMGGPTCTPTTVEGGVKTNIVPAACSFTVDQRVPPDFDAEALEAAFHGVVDEVDLPAGTTAAVEVLLRATPCEAAPDDPHVRAVHENATAIYGHEVPLVGHRGFTDARFFAAAGAETVNFGPGDEHSNPHGANERVSTEQVVAVGAIVAASVVDIARS